MMMRSLILALALATAGQSGAPRAFDTSALKPYTVDLQIDGRTLQPTTVVITTDTGSYLYGLTYQSHWNPTPTPQPTPTPGPSPIPPIPNPTPTPTPTPTPGPGPTPQSEGQQAAQALAAAWRVAYAEEAKTYLADLQAGKSLADANTAFQSRMAARRAAVFAATVQPVLAAILPEGQAFTTREQFDRYVAVWTEIIKGMQP